jgi:protoporphyrin/coproporphyrin ferrochelatase
MISCHMRMPGEAAIPADAQYAVLILSYGGPDSLDDIEPFLLDIRGGRQTPPELIEEIRERYALIGGKSPLLEITCDQAEALEKLLNTPDEGESPLPPNQHQYRVYVGMRHWTPYIRDVVADMVQQGVKNVVTICMTPYYSKMTVGAYYEKFFEAVENTAANWNVIAIEHWHQHPFYIEAVAEKARAALQRFPEETRNNVQLIFTAHSLPAAIVEQGDPYEAHLRETAQLIVDRLEMGAKSTPPLAERWHFCYQSAGAKQVVWLGPPLEEVMVQQAEAGHKQQLVIPIGFLVDHVEILYDLDIECAHLAREYGVDFKRTDSLNTSPLFIAALADIVKQAIACHENG